MAQAGDIIAARSLAVAWLTFLDDDRVFEIMTVRTNKGFPQAVEANDRGTAGEKSGGRSEAGGRVERPCLLPGGEDVLTPIQVGQVNVGIPITVSTS